jgi:hypothetical protein
MPRARQKRSVGGVDGAESVAFARLVEHGLREDLKRLHEDLVEEESRLTALEEIRTHSMRDFEALSEQGVTTAEAALYYTLFHHLTREITIQGRLVLNARHRVCDKQAAVRAAAEDRCRAEVGDSPLGAGQVRLAGPAPAGRGSWAPARSALKKAS